MSYIIEVVLGNHKIFFLWLI